MRNAVILVVNLKGVATETIKNIVLAGIGKLVIVDGSIVSGEDLGAGFFFREEDVGRKAGGFFSALPFLPLFSYDGPLGKGIARRCSQDSHRESESFRYRRSSI